MWKQRSNPKICQITRALVTRFSEMTPAPNDRPLSEKRVKAYHKMILKGEFRPVTWAVAHCAEDGKEYRVNGKHTSVMLSRMEVLPEYNVAIEEYDCDTLEDVGRVYATFDSSMGSRTARDINRSFAGTVPELTIIPDKIVHVAVSGINYHQIGPSAAYAKNAADRAEVMFDNIEFIQWLNTTLTPGPDTPKSPRTGRKELSHIARGPVVGVMYGTWQKAKSDATRFWTAVRDGSGERPTDPDRKLQMYLLMVGMSSGGSTGRTKIVSPREIYVKCIHAWNAWRTDGPTNLKYHPDADIPPIK